MIDVLCGVKSNLCFVCNLTGFYQITLFTLDNPFSFIFLGLFQFSEFAILLVLFVYFSRAVRERHAIYHVNPTFD